MEERRILQRMLTPEICTICFETILSHRKAFIQSCRHTFCFRCILKWANVQNVCPLCKLQFQEIKYHVMCFKDHQLNHDNLKSFIRKPARREMGSSEEDVPTLPSMTIGPIFNRSRCLLTTVQYRMEVYFEKLTPHNPEANTGCDNLSSAEYYREHPESLERIRTWLRREMLALNLLLGDKFEQHTMFEFVMHLLTHYDIKSDIFKDALENLFGDYMEAFIVELHYFSVSKMSVDEYDQEAKHASCTKLSITPTLITLNTCKSVIEDIRKCNVISPKARICLNQRVFSDTTPPPPPSNQAHNLNKHSPMLGRLRSMDPQVSPSPPIDGAMFQIGKTNVNLFRYSIDIGKKVFRRVKSPAINVPASQEDRIYVPCNKRPRLNGGTDGADGGSSTCNSMKTKMQ